MIEAAKQDWNSGAYARFRGLRLRPALDLLMQIRKEKTGQYQSPDYFTVD